MAYKIEKIFLTVFSVVLMSQQVSATNRDDDNIRMQCLDMLVDFTKYVTSIYTEANQNNQSVKTGYFKANNAGMSNEDGVRTNADMSMICAFVYRYGTEKEYQLPVGITYDSLKKMSLSALRYAYSTHKSNRLQTCTDNKYWGLCWESSLWTESIAFAAYFLGKDLTAADWMYIKKVLEAEADYDLDRKVPTGYIGDTKAEENGWETNVLAAACSLMPDHPHARLWYDKMREFAFHCLTVAADSKDTTPVDGIPAYKWYHGQNLYDDYTLQNHNFFHTNYQSVIIQELAESILILRMMGKDHFPVSQTLLWHQKDMFDNVIKYFALPDGELAMPNGSDWSMLTYDQMPSFAAIATLFGDGDALMMEMAALRNTYERQQTTRDGSWMLRPDIGARRMGVTAHRVMMTYLMHDIIGSKNVVASYWDDFVKRYGKPRYYESQKTWRNLTPDYYVSIAQCDGLHTFSGIFYPIVRGNENILIPYRKNGTGSLIGWINNSKLKVKENIVLQNSYVTKIVLEANDSSYAQEVIIDANDTKGILINITITANNDMTVNSDKTGMLVMSLDPFTREQRKISYTAGGHVKTTAYEGKETLTIDASQIDIDDALSILAETCVLSNSKKKNAPRCHRMIIGDPENVNSIQTVKIYPFAGNKGTILRKGDKIINKLTLRRFSTLQK